jgi:hypothetical protein
MHFPHFFFQGATFYFFPGREKKHPETISARFFPLLNIFLLWLDYIEIHPSSEQQQLQQLRELMITIRFVRVRLCIMDAIQSSALFETFQSTGAKLGHLDKGEISFFGVFCERLSGELIPADQHPHRIRIIS